VYSKLYGGTEVDGSDGQVNLGCGWPGRVENHISFVLTGQYDLCLIDSHDESMVLGWRGGA